MVWHIIVIDIDIVQTTNKPEPYLWRGSNNRRRSSSTPAAEMMVAGCWPTWNYSTYILTRGRSSRRVFAISQILYSLHTVATFVFPTTLSSYCFRCSLDYIFVGYTNGSLIRILQWLLCNWICFRIFLSSRNMLHNTTRTREIWIFYRIHFISYPVWIVFRSLAS